MHLFRRYFDFSSQHGSAHAIPQNLEPPTPSEIVALLLCTTKGPVSMTMRGLASNSLGWPQILSH
jgi:hypothetical protein